MPEDMIVKEDLNCIQKKNIIKYYEKLYTIRQYNTIRRNFMFKLSIYTFYSFYNKQKFTFFLLYFGISIILFSFLFLFGRYFMVYEQASEEYMETKTMYIKVGEILSDEKKRAIDSFSPGKFLFFRCRRNKR